jgi:phosphatidylglycerophosphatase C
MHVIKVFDLDKTITRADTFIPFLITWYLKNPRISIKLLILPWHIFCFFWNQRSRSQLKEIFLIAFMGRADISKIDAHCEYFANKIIESHCHPAALELISRCQMKGEKLILASASLDIYVGKIGKKLGFLKTFATKCEVKDDLIFTGYLPNGTLRGSKKSEVVKAYISENYKTANVTAYSDHLFDLPLLKFANKGVVVNPNFSLNKIAKLNRFTIERWK